VGNLAFISDFENLVVSCQGIQLVLSAMSHHSEYPALVTDAVFFLKNLAFGENGRNLIMANSGISRTLEIMKKHMNYAELIELSLNLLFDLSFSGGVEAFMNSPIGIPLLLEAMNTYADSVPVLRESIRTLARLYTHSDEASRIKLIRAGTNGVLRAARTHNATNADLVKQIDNTFSRISQIPITYECAPSTTVPSLLELAARTVVDLHVCLPGADDLCEDLQSYIQQANRCSLCQGCYIDSHYELVSFVPIPEYTIPLPVMVCVCSRSCFERAICQGNS